MKLKLNRIIWIVILGCIFLNSSLAIYSMDTGIYMDAEDLLSIESVIRQKIEDGEIIPDDNTIQSETIKYIKSDGSLARYKPCMYCGHIIDTKSGLIFPIIKNKPIEDISI